MAMSLQDVENARFRLVQGSHGYRASDVDEFLDRVMQAMSRGEDLAPLVRKARFKIARRGEQGYSAGDVDDFLDKLQPGAAASGPTASSNPVFPGDVTTHAPSAFGFEPLAEEKSFWQKLFKR